ncbi:MAG: GNAT family N-acetyltransferase [Parvularculaceae bacterium]
MIADYRALFGEVLRCRDVQLFHRTAYGGEAIHPRSALYARAAARSFFLSPAWIGAWLSGKPEGVELFVLRGIIGGETYLLGLFGRSVRRSPPVIGSRALHLNEFGVSSFDTVYIEYNDLLLSASTPETARNEALKALFEYFSSEDDLLFRNVRSELVEAIESANEGRRVLHVLNRQPTFAVDLEAARGGDDALSTLSSSARSQIRRSIRRYEERGELKFKIAEGETAREEVWKKLSELHLAGWRSRGVSGAFGAPAFEAFHKHLRDHSPECVHLIEISAGDETIGCLYNFAYEDRALNYQSGFRFEEDNQLKPGFVAHALAIRHYAEAGLSVYDLLAGDAPYKRRLANEGESFSSLVLERRDGARALARHAARRLKSALTPAAGTRQT